MVMSNKLYGFLISILILLPTLCMTVFSVQASPTLNIGLTRFKAIPLDNAAPMEWVSEDPDRSEVIGTNHYPADNRSSGSDSEIQNTEKAVPSGGLAGKIFLWLAFFAALVIFTAAVLGAILLYTRQRYKE